MASENTNALADTAVRGANHPNIENIEVKYTAPLQGSQCFDSEGVKSEALKLVEKATPFLSDFSKGRLRKSSATTFTSLFDTTDAGVDNDSEAFDEHDETLQELEKEL